jgi:hypothetical protein
MPKFDLVSRGPILEYIKEYTNGLNIANDLKDQIIQYFEEKLQEEINRFCDLSQEVTELQGKRTIQERDWKFIQKRLK